MPNSGQMANVVLVPLCWGIMTIGWIFCCPCMLCVQRNKIPQIIEILCEVE
jgi:hypothetical protein